MAVLPMHFRKTQVLHLYSIHAADNPVTHATWTCGACRDLITWSMPWNAFIAQHRISDGLHALKASNLKELLREMGVEEAELSAMMEKSELVEKVGWVEAMAIESRAYGSRAPASSPSTSGAAAGPSAPADSSKPRGSHGGSQQYDSGAASGRATMAQEHRGWDMASICANSLTESGCRLQRTGCRSNHPAPCIHFPNCSFNRCVFLHKGFCYKYQRWGEKGCNKAPGKCPFGVHGSN